MTEHPQDDAHTDDKQADAAPPEPTAATPAEQPAAAEPVVEASTEQPAAAEPVAEGPIEEPAAAEPVVKASTEEPAAADPVAEVATEEPVAQAPAPEAVPTPEEPAVEATPAAAAQAPVVEEEEEIELAPRQKPEIPGADLEPDIVPEGEQFLDAEAQAAAEAEAEAAAARELHEAQEETHPIADAAIDLAAGARYAATGKRKTAVARVTLKPGTGVYTINGKTLNDFFPRETLQRNIRLPLETVGYEARMDVVARMHGGGVSAQAGALRHGISRALIDADPHLRGELKRRGFLTRDPRVKERKKAGLKKARKRPQFSKR